MSGSNWARTLWMCFSATHTGPEQERTGCYSSLGFPCQEKPFCVNYSCLSLFPLTCSYLPAAGERLSRSLAGFPSDTSTANCQTGFLGQTLINHSACWGNWDLNVFDYVVTQAVSCYNAVLLFLINWHWMYSYKKWRRCRWRIHMITPLFWILPLV